MDDIIHNMNKMNIEEQFKIIENDLKQLAYIYYNGDLDNLDLPVLEYDYPYQYLEPRYYQTLLVTLSEYMKYFDPFVNINDAHSLLEYYLDLAKS